MHEETFLLAVMLKGGTRGSHLNWLCRFSAKVKYGIIKKAHQPGAASRNCAVDTAFLPARFIAGRLSCEQERRTDSWTGAGARRGPPKPKLSGYRPNRPRITRLDWQMADQGVAHLSESAVYRILDSENLLSR